MDSPDLDEFLDEAIGSAADDGEDAPASDLGDESDFTSDEQDSDEEDAELLDDDAPEDEEEDPDSDAPDDDEEVVERLTAAERRAQEAEYALEQERAAIRQAAAHFQTEQQRLAAASGLLQKRASMTDEEWAAYSQQLLTSFQQHRDQQKDAIIARFVAERQYAEYHAAESQAHEVVMNHVREVWAERGWTMTELEADYLYAQPNAVAFKAALGKAEDRRERIIAKQRQTRAQNTREQRGERGADRGSVRGTGGARGARKTYDNFNPDRWDDYVDDVFSSR
jgi:hypothetical protein